MLCMQNAVCANNGAEKEKPVRYMVVHTAAGGRMTWEHMTTFGRQEPLGLTVTFPYHHVSLQKAQKELAALLSQNQVEWLRPSRQGLWLFRSDAFKAQFPDYSNETWLRGDILVPMDHDVTKKRVFHREEDSTHCQFVVTPEMIEEQMPKKVFLSHKGADKPMVRRYKEALESVGIVAWLDEDAMPAGVELERGLLAGFNESCAAVFFVTESFRDAGFLATEINYALGERRTKQERFSIITLLIGELADSIAVPPLLRPYIWKRATTELVGFTEIVRGLPVKLGSPAWKLE